MVTMAMQPATHPDNRSIIFRVRKLVAQYGELPVSIDTISDSTELYAMGLKSFAVVQLMLALEAEFDLEFPESRLTRRSFSDIRTIATCIEDLTSARS